LGVFYLEALSKRQETLTDWLQCWFSPTKRTGYVAVTDFDTFQKFYGAKDIQALIRDTKGREKRFISLNAFAFGSRENVNLKQIRNIGIDLDQYKLGMTIDEGLDELQVLILEDIIPEPNLVLKSRGIQIFYSIENGASPDMAFLVSYITDQYIGKLKHIGADSNAKDLSRVMRVPNSINERNGAVVEAEIWNPVPYTLQELQAYCKPLTEFATRKRKKANVIRLIPKASEDKLTFFYRTNHVRLVDLEKLIELRNGDFTHKRNIFLYVYAYHQALICSSFADLEVFLTNVFERIHSREAKPMSKAEFRRTIKSAYEDAREFFEYFKGNGYRIIFKQNDGIIKPYKTENLIDLLDITEYEQRQLRSLHGSLVAKEKDAERKRKERRAAGVRSREEYESDRQAATNEKLDKIKTLLDTGLSKTEIAKELGISRQQVYNMIKKMEV
jgi:Helix-turn-helix domain of resolvase